MKPTKGTKALSPSESVRLAMIASVDRQRAIERIAEYLRTSSRRACPGREPVPPDQYYKPRKSR